MSPEARLIAAAILRSHGGVDVYQELAIIESGLPKPEGGIRGMVPTAYLKDILEGVIARLEAIDGSGPLNRAEYAEALNYAKLRLADVEAL